WSSVRTNTTFGRLSAAGSQQATPTIVAAANRHVRSMDTFSKASELAELEANSPRFVVQPLGLISQSLHFRPVSHFGPQVAQLVFVTRQKRKRRLKRPAKSSMSRSSSNHSPAAAPALRLNASLQKFSHL